MKRAEAFAEGDPDAASITGPSLRIVVPPPASEPGMDPVLADIFVKEMRGHLEVIRQFLAAATPGGEPHAIGEPLFRACHTLLGSARMAGFEPAMRLATPLAEHLRWYFESGTGVSDAGIDALHSAADAIEAMADALAAGRSVELDSAAVIALDALAVRDEPTLVPAAPVRSETAEAQPAAAAPESPSYSGSGFDPEIAAIFAEEAAEILDNSEAALQDVRERQDQPPWRCCSGISTR